MVNVVLLIYLFFISSLLGEKLLSWSKISADNFLEKALFDLGAGLGVLAYGTYLLGLLGILYRPVLWVSAASLSLLLGKSVYPFLASTYRELITCFKGSMRQTDKFLGLLLSLLFLHVVLNLVGALAPEIGFDALWYHLSIPKIYIASHKVSFIPHINVSGYPRIMEMLFTLGFGLSGEQLAKLIHFAAGVLSAAGIFVVGKRFFGFSSAVVATVVFYAMQPINMLSATADIDLGLTLFSFLALLALLNAIELKETKWLVLSGLFAGLVLGIKYQGALMALALAFSWVIFGYRQESSPKINKVTGILAFSIPAFLVFLPWPIDNLINTGNPVYPLFNKFFGIADSWEQVVIGSHTSGGWFQNHNLASFLTLPWKLTMGSCDGWVTPLLLLLVPWGVFLRRKHRVFLFLLVFILLFYSLFFLLPYWIVRFFVPLLPALSLAASYVWYRLGSYDKILKKFLNLVIILVVFANLGFLFMKNGPLLSVSLGLEPREAYLSRTLGWYDVNRFARENVSAGNKILVYGAQLFYYFDFDYLWNQPIRGHGALQSAKELRGKGISHVLLLVDRGGPQNLWEIRGFEESKGSPYFRLVYQRDIPNPVRTNAARGAKVYAINIKGQ